MPIVFVHGVATRRGHKYDLSVTLRNALLRQYVYDKLGFDVGVPVTDAYWGDDAAAFRWNHASVPIEGDEAFGRQAAFEDVILAEFVTADLQDVDKALVTIGATDPEAAFDVLWAAAAAGSDDDDADALATLAHRVSAAMPTAHAKAIFAAADDEAVVEGLAALLRRGQPEAIDESFGADKFAGRLNEGLFRVRGAAGRMIGRGATRLLRSKLHEGGAVFIGDVMTYLNERGTTRTDAGPILTSVMAAIDQAVADSPDTPLVIIAHSMGGNISYDILSHFRRDLKCDLLLTVGSQVGLFEELCLLARGRHEGCPDLRSVAALPRVRRWINVFDYNDVLGFAAKEIFDGVQDFAYSTGRGVLKAHSSYFVLPSFYRRLADRI
jgi:hypothetical protein